MKMTGITKAWFNRWREEPGTRDWNLLTVDFPIEAVRKRTVTSTLSETLMIKMVPGEDTIRFRLRMELYVDFLRAVGGAADATTDTAVESPANSSAVSVSYEMDKQIHSLLSRAFICGLGSSQPYKKKKVPSIQPSNRRLQR